MRNIKMLTVVSQTKQTDTASRYVFHAKYKRHIFGFGDDKWWRHLNPNMLHETTCYVKIHQYGGGRKWNQSVMGRVTYIIVPVFVKLS
jgi:hypothetical protein